MKSFFAQVDALIAKSNATAAEMKSLGKAHGFKMKPSNNGIHFICVCRKRPGGIACKAEIIDTPEQLPAKLEGHRKLDDQRAKDIAAQRREAERAKNQKAARAA